MALRTRRVYDRLAAVYPASTYFFHRKAHKLALELAGIEDGSNVLEIATGSGEMFRRLLQANPKGFTVGIDLSPNMAAVTQGRVRKEFPRHRTALQAVDARNMPFPDETFDSIVSCYLWELLGDEDDVISSLAEAERVLKPGGQFITILIGQDSWFFNQAYKVATQISPAFWGAQVEEWVPGELEALGFRIEQDRRSKQTFYPSRIVVARKRVR